MPAERRAPVLGLLTVAALAAHGSGVRATPLVRRLAPEHENGPRALSQVSDTVLMRRASPPEERHRADYNEETKIAPSIRVPQTPWNDKTKLPVTLETVIAILWIVLVASMPMILIRLEGEESVTRAQCIIFAVTAILLVSGILLFTLLIDFESAHFEYSRTLTIVESVYFLSQVLTTVGYGDVTPANPTGQVFVAIYVLISLLIIANVISEVQECIGRHARRLLDALIKRYVQAKEVVDTGLAMATGSVEDTESEEAELETFRREILPAMRRSFFHLDPPLVEFRDTISNALQFFFFVVLGCVFFMNWPGENKTTLSAIYMSVITLSTVGFGVVTPQTEAGKVFSSFWMLFGSAALVGIVGALTNVYDQIKTREHWFNRDINKEQEEFFESLPPEMDKFEFVKRCLLYKEVVPLDDVENLEAIFEYMPQKDKKAPKATLEELIKEYTERRRSVDMSSVASRSLRSLSSLQLHFGMKNEDPVSA